MNRKTVVVAVAVVACLTGCSKPCEGEWPHPASAWAGHGEFVPQGATVCNATSDGATMDIETASNAFVLVTLSAEGSGWQRTSQDIAKPDSQSAVFTKDARTVTVSFLKQNGKFTRVLAHDMK